MYRKKIFVANNCGSLLAVGDARQICCGGENGRLRRQTETGPESLGNRYTCTRYAAFCNPKELSEGRLDIVGVNLVVKPPAGKRVLILNGPYRDAEAVLEGIDEKNFSATLALDSVSTSAVASVLSEHGSALAFGLLPPGGKLENNCNNLSYICLY